MEKSKKRGIKKAAAIINKVRIEVQKKTLFCKEQFRADVAWLRGEWIEYIRHIDVNRLVYLDEMSVNIGMTRLYGRSPKGERIVEYVPDVRYKRVSVISTIRVIFLSVREISKKWTMAAKNWGMAYSQIMIFFADRFA